MLPPLAELGFKAILFTEFSQLCFLYGILYGQKKNYQKNITCKEGDSVLSLSPS